MHNEILLLAVLLPFTISLEVTLESRSPINRTLEQSCPQGMFLFGSLQGNILDMVRVPKRHSYDYIPPVERAERLRSNKCSKLLINCSLRSIMIVMMHCCSDPAEPKFVNTDLSWIGEHLEVIVEPKMFYLQGCMDHMNRKATRGRIAIVKEPYREVEIKECQVLFEFSFQRKLQYLAMRYVAMLVLFGSVGICCISLMIYDGIHYGLEPNCSVMLEIYH